jgi:hypothetical protein
LYALLDGNDLRAVRETRLSSLEREHFSLVLKIEELNVIGAPADSPQRLEYMRGQEVAEACIAHHQRQLGFVAAAPRVTPEVGKSTSDDIADREEHTRD